MRERPIEHLVDALLALGAQVSYREKAGCPPILLKGGLVNGGNVSIRGDISSQYLTALLMALPLAANDSNITTQGEQVSKPYLDITLGMLKNLALRRATRITRHSTSRATRHTDHQVVS